MRADEGGLQEALWVYLVADRAAAGARHLTDVVGAALDGGATCIQYRAKDVAIRTMLREGRAVRDAVRERGATFIVNDRVDVAAALRADGVHLGENDMPVCAARRVLGSDTIIGATVRTAAGGRRAVEAGADYLGAGPVYCSPTKPDVAPVLGPTGLADIARRVPVPVVGIGGITGDNAGAVIRAGAAGVAVVSAVMDAADPRATAEKLREIVEGMIR